MTETQIRQLISSTVDRELKKQKTDLEKSAKASVDAGLKGLKNEIDKEFKNINKDLMTKQDIKDLVKKIFIKQHKFMWEKASFITSFLNQV